MRDRLVGQDQFRFLNQSPGDRNALLFTARESADESMTEPAEPEGIKAPMRMRPFGSGKPRQRSPPWVPGERAGEDILKRRSIASEMELLEDQANAGSKVAGSMETLALTAISDRSHGMRAHAGEGLQQRRFARPGRPDHSHEPAAGHFQAQIPDQDTAAPFHGQACHLQMRCLARRRGIRWTKGLHEKKWLPGLLRQGECVHQWLQMFGLVNLNEPRDEGMVAQLVVFRLVQCQKSPPQLIPVSLGNAPTHSQHMGGHRPLFGDFLQTGTLFR
jgi:hypothetical protein